MLKLKMNLRLAVLCAFSVIMASSQIGGPERAAAQSADQCTVADAIQAEATEGTMLAGYPTLAAAFQAVNAGTHRGQITLKVCADTSETQSAVLFPGDTAPAAYTSLLLTPAGNAPRTISGSLNGSPLIDLNGADNVTIDGINHNGNSLTIANTSTSSTANTSTIRFINDATNNVIENAIVLGSATVTGGGGTIFFATAQAGGVGNDNNILRANQIGPTANGLPSRGISSIGTTSAIQFNSANKIENNRIYDYFASSGASAGLILGAGTSGWTVLNNRFFQTGPRVQSGSGVHAGIQLTNASIGGFTLSRNTIGFESDKEGTYSITSSSTGAKVYAIFASAHSNTITSAIDGNFIGSFEIAGSGYRGSVASTPFAGINILAGSFEIGTTEGNKIGSTLAPIAFTGTTTEPTEIYGILHSQTSGNKHIANNRIGSIYTSASGAIRHVFGIRALSNSSGRILVNANVIGGTSGAVINGSTNVDSTLKGIVTEVGISEISGNEVTSLSTSSSNPGLGEFASVIGISVVNASAPGPNLVQRNRVIDLRNSSSTGSVLVSGLFHAGPNNHESVIDSNFISGLGVSSASNAAALHGIEIENSAGLVRNNMVALGQMVGVGCQIFGIRAKGTTPNSLFHNSIHVGGTDVPGSSATWALFSEATGTRVFRNNILVNTRSNGAGSGKHYAARIAGTTASPSGLTSNNNVLWGPGIGGFLGLYNNIDRTTLSDWQTATGQDSNSFSEDPKFVAPDALVPNLHIQPNSGSIIDGNGFDVGVLHDFDGEARSELTPVDIGADAGNFAVSTGNPGTLNFAQAEYVVDEDIGTVGLTVERSGGSAGAVSAAFQIHDATATGGGTCSAGVDMINTGGLVEFADGETSKLIQIEICNDDLYEGDENFSVTIANPTGGATIGKLYSATVTIADDDEQPVIEFGVASYQQAEGRELVIEVVRTGSMAEPASAEWSVADVTAVNGVCGSPEADYAASGGVVEFAPGESSAEIRIALCSDMRREDPAETAVVSLSSPAGAVLGGVDAAVFHILDAATEFEAAGPGMIVAGGVGESYPSELLVAGRGMMAGVRVTLFGVTHDAPERLDVLVVSPGGRAFVLMAAAGGGFAAADGVITFEDAAAGHLADDGPIAAGINHRPTACGAVADLPLPAPAGPYYLPGCGVGGAAETLGSAFGGTEANGIWRLYVRDRGTGAAVGGKARAQGGGGSIAGWGLQILAPTQAGVSVAGRVTDADGRGIANAAVAMSGGGFVAVARTNAFGFYVLDAVPAGLAYTVSPSARGRTFINAPRVIVLNEDLTGLNFAATP